MTFVKKWKKKRGKTRDSLFFVKEGNVAADAHLPKRSSRHLYRSHRNWKDN